jgi:uncharacterized membrane protein YdbT with pleckstrin-like domain
MTYSARPAWRHQWFAVTVAALLALGSMYLAVFLALTARNEYSIGLGFTLALFALLALVIVYRKYCWRFIITDDIIESHYGIIARNVRSIRVRDLRNVNARQSLMQRILGIGDIEFSSAGGSDIEVSFYGIRDPLGVKRQVQTLQGNG